MGINNWDVDKKEGPAKEFQRAGKLTGFENVKKIIADQLHSVAETLGENRADQDGESVHHG